MDDLFSLWQPLLFFGAGLGSFGIALYNYPSLRRRTIENIFSGSDYIYDKYNRLRYDNKIREVEIRKHPPTMISINSPLFKKELKKNDQNLEDHNLKQLLNIFSNNYSLSHVSYRDNDYYTLKSDKKSFELSHIINLPWLAVSLKVETNDQQCHEIDITSKLKKFWIKINRLPFHLEYYDLWIKGLLPELNLEKDEIKHLELVIIDEMGNFINHSDVLIIPHSQSDKIDLIPLKPINSNQE
jgi:hypothetical protein